MNWEAGNNVERCYQRFSKITTYNKINYAETSIPKNQVTDGAAGLLRCLSSAWPDP